MGYFAAARELDLGPDPLTKAPRVYQDGDFVPEANDNPYLRVDPWVRKGVIKWVDAPRPAAKAPSSSTPAGDAKPAPGKKR